MHVYSSCNFGISRCYNRWLMNYWQARPHVSPTQPSVRVLATQQHILSQKERRTSTRSDLTLWRQNFCKKSTVFPEWILHGFIEWTKRSRRDLSISSCFIKIGLANLPIFLVGKFFILTIIPDYLTSWCRAFSH